jgi:hypothetical protein
VRTREETADLRCSKITCPSAVLTTPYTSSISILDSQWKKKFLQFLDSSCLWLIRVIPITRWHTCYTAVYIHFPFGCCHVLPQSSGYEPAAAFCWLISWFDPIECLSHSGRPDHTVLLIIRSDRPLRLGDENSCPSLRNHRADKWLPIRGIGVWDPENGDFL